MRIDVDKGATRKLDVENPAMLTDEILRLRPDIEYAQSYNLKSDV